MSAETEIVKVLGLLETSGEAAAAIAVRGLIQENQRLRREVAELERENDTWNSHGKSRAKRRANEDE